MSEDGISLEEALGEIELATAYDARCQVEGGPSDRELLDIEPFLREQAARLGLDPALAVEDTRRWLRARYGPPREPSQ